MNRNAQILLFLSWITTGGIIITSEIQVLFFLGFFFLATGFIAIINNVIQRQHGSNTPLLSLGPAKYKKVINKSENIDFREKLMNSLDELPFEVTRIEDDKVVLKAGWSVYTWGEIIKIDFQTISLLPLQAGAFFHFS